MSDAAPNQPEDSQDLQKLVDAAAGIVVGSGRLVECAKCSKKVPEAGLAFHEYLVHETTENVSSALELLESGTSGYLCLLFVCYHISY